MNKIFTLIFLLFAHLLKAQTTINSLIIPDVGTVISAQTKTDNTIDPGSSGNQVWDFSSVTFTSTASTSHIMDPSVTAHGGSFPSATRAELTSGGNYAYYKFLSSEQTMLGMYDNSYSTTIVYSDPITLIKTPIAYNNTQTDNFAANYTANGYPVYIKGNVSTVYDGYGTLKTVNGTYNNIIRLVATRQETDSIDYGGGIAITIHTTTVSYSWVVPGQIYPLFAITDISSDYYGNSRTAYLYDPSFLTGNKNALLQNLNLSVSPNPTTSNIFVDFRDLPSDNYNISVEDQIGSVMINENIYVSQGESREVNLNGLTNGIYILKISSSKGIVSKKIIKK